MTLRRRCRLGSVNGRLRRKRCFVCIETVRWQILVWRSVLCRVFFCGSRLFGNGIKILFPRQILKLRLLLGKIICALSRFFFRLGHLPCVSTFGSLRGLRRCGNSAANGIFNLRKPWKNWFNGRIKFWLAKLNKAHFHFYSRICAALNFNKSILKKIQCIYNLRQSVVLRAW